MGYPQKYLQLNQSNTKPLNLVVQIAGVSGYFAVAPIYTKVRYGDTRLQYGLPGLKYGGLVVVDNVRPWIMWDSNVTISQKVEPEQGRGSVSTMTLKFIDYDGVMSQLISPGALLDEPLGNKLCTISIGYTNSSFPDDYFKVFRGYISNTTSGAGWVQLEFSDANIKSRQDICYGGISQTTADMTATDSVVSLGAVDGYFAPIPDTVGANDWQYPFPANPLCTLTAGSTTVAITAFTPPYNVDGYAVAGVGVPVGATVTSVTTPTSTSFTMSVAATKSGTFPLLMVGSPDTTRTVRAFLKIDNEWMEYAPRSLVKGVSFIADLTSGSNVLTNWIVGAGVINVEYGSPVTGLGIPANTVVTGINPVAHTVTLSNNVTLTIPSSTVVQGAYAIVFRGSQFSRGTTPEAHTANTECDNGIQIVGNVIDLILKLYLSGWDSLPWITGQPCVALGTTLVPGESKPGAVLFAIDVLDEYGLVVGDQLTVTGSALGNDGDYQILGFEDGVGGDSNRIVLTDATFTLENPTSATISFRSQFDTLPVTCGLSNTPQDIDVQGFLDAKQTYYSTGQFDMQLFIQQSITGKDFIESELFLPIGAYSITRLGKLSIAVTSPPLVGQKLIQLDDSNVLTPQNITVQRALNTRRFYNLIQYSFDADDSGNFLSEANLIDTASQGLINLTMSLPIQSQGLRTELGAGIVISSRGTALLNRFKKAAYEITLDVNWQAGSMIEVGDVVILNDPGTLQITDLETGKRGLGRRLFEVISRTLKPQSGNASLVLLSSLGYTIDQRYATIAPSSIVGAGSTTATVVITDSFGALYPGDEPKKWDNLIGCTIVVHDAAWTYQSTATLLGFDTATPYKMLLDRALSFTPSAGDIVDVDSYGTGTDPNYDKSAKLFYAFQTPTLTVVSGIDQSNFTVSSGDAAKLNVGQPITLHNADYSLLPDGVNTVSPEVVVNTISGTTITVKTPIGFVPVAGQKIEGVGFKDGGSPYRFI